MLLVLESQKKIVFIFWLLSVSSGVLTYQTLTRKNFYSIWPINIKFGAMVEHPENFKLKCFSCTFVLVFRYLFDLQTSYLVPRYNSNLRTQESIILTEGHRFWSRSQVKFKCPNIGKKIKHWAISFMLLHPKISYLVPRYTWGQRWGWPWKIH